MSFKLRHLRLRAETLSGTFGADIPFTEGLNVLWADNTMGKSTCLQAVLYGLGLEKMLSNRREVPLTFVMTTQLDDPDTGERHNVLESFVSLELENGKGTVITVRRNVKSDEYQKLINVHFGPLLTEPSEHYSQKDYYVLDPGSAKRESGFYKMFADFVGWDLPTVKKYDGGETMLYLETLFPLFYVEQKAGWSALPALFPTYFQIREVGRRAVEYVMGLDTHELELRKQQLDLEIQASKAAWTAKRDELIALGSFINARLDGVTTGPMLSLADIERAMLLLPHGDEWRPLLQEASAIRAEIAELLELDVPTVDEVAPELAAEIDQLTNTISALNTQRNTLFRSRQIELAQIDASGARLAALEEDLKKNQDAQKLRTLGSAITSTLVLDHCPTCDQVLTDTLLPQRVGVAVMPVEENIEYIKAQKAIFVQVQNQSRAFIFDVDKRLAALTDEVGELSSRLRALKADLTAPANAASVSAIHRRLRLENRLQTLVDAQTRFSEGKLGLEVLSGKHAVLLNERESLPSERYSSADREKILTLTRLIREQVASFGFSTFPVDELGIAEDSFRPEKQGFEIGFELSASDGIRLKWAYQLALLELARHHQTNHAGVLFFDEPRQQETKKASVEHLFKRAAKAREYGQQVIFATSEDREQIDSFLHGLSVNLVAFEGKIVKRLDTRR